MDGQLIKKRHDGLGDSCKTDLTVYRDGRSFMSGSMGVHGAHTHVRGKPQVSVRLLPCLRQGLLFTGSYARLAGDSVSISLLTVRALGLQVHSPASSFTWVWGT